MNNITVIANPLMQPVQYEGQVYFTSHYFHQQYRNNHADEGKFSQLKNFNKLIRSIEAYQAYLERQDIVELTGKETGSNLEPVTKATKRNPVMLINATAQIALTHHLDDEISKATSVAVNERTAKELPVADSFARVAQNHRARLQLAKMCGLKGNKALIAANNWTHRDDGVNILQSLGVDRMKDDIQSAEMTATEIGIQAGVPGNGQGKAQYVNLALWKLGFLNSVIDKNDSLKWRISDKGHKSDHIEYDDMDKVKGKRGTIQVIVYRETLIPIIQEAGLITSEYQDLKVNRKEQSEKEEVA